MHRKIKLLFSISILLIAHSVQSASILGGEFQYHLIHPDSLQVQLILTHDCQGVPISSTTDILINGSCGSSSHTLTLQNGSIHISQICNTLSTSCNSPTSNINGVMESVYSSIIPLDSNCTDWTLSYSHCCRNTSSNNIVSFINQGLYLSAQVNNTVFEPNHSPTFQLTKAPFICANQSSSIPLNIRDQDNDSLVVSLIEASVGASFPAIYSNGHSAYQPFGNSAAFSFDSVACQINVTPSSAGVYTLTFRIDEFDSVSGVHLGYVIRDFEINVLTGCIGVNNIPEISSGGISNFSGDGVLQDSNSIIACHGDLLSFDLIYSDLDIATGFDSITLTHDLYSTLDSNVSVIITNGNPAMAHIEWIIPQDRNDKINFTFNAKDQYCPVPGSQLSNFDITIKSRPDAGQDQSICGAQTAHLNAIGLPPYNWNVISGTPINLGTNFSCDTCSSVLANPAISTSYELTTGPNGGCSNKDTVTVSVVQDFNLTTSPDTGTCGSDTFTLSVSQSVVGNYQYKWSDTHSFLSANNIPNPVVKALKTTDYQVTVTSSLGCSKTAAIHIDIMLPSTSASIAISDTLYCQNDSFQLDISYLNSNTACQTSNYSCEGSSGNTIKQGATMFNTSTSFPTPFANYFQSAKHQYLYKADELIANGYEAGLISSISFYIEQINGTDEYSNFSIQLGCSSDNQLTQWQPVINVRSGFTLKIDEGWNTIEFTNPYQWDGASNLIIQTCFDNNTTGSTFNSSIAYSNTSFWSTIHTESQTVNVCDSTNYFSVTFNRPNIRFSICQPKSDYVYNWITGSGIGDSTIHNPLFHPDSSGIFKVELIDTLNYCSIDTIEKFIKYIDRPYLNFTIPTGICQSVDTIFLDAGNSEGNWSGSGIISQSNGIFSPSKVGAGTHNIRYEILNRCNFDTIVRINILGVKAGTILSKNEYCNDEENYQLTTSDSGGQFHELNNSFEIDSNGIFNPSDTGIQTGGYTIIYTNSDQGCIGTDTLFIRIHNSVLFNFPDSIFICDNKQIIKLFDSLQMISSEYAGLQYHFNGTGITDNDSGLINIPFMSYGSYNISIQAIDSNKCEFDFVSHFELLKTDYVKFSNDVVYTDQTNIPLPVNLPMSNIEYVNYPINPLADTIILDSNYLFSPGDYSIDKWMWKFIYTNEKGCMGYSEDILTIDWPLVIENQHLTSYFKAYPNPIEDDLFLELNSDYTSDIKIQLIDMTGKIILEQEVQKEDISGQLSIPFENYKPGTYILQITSNLGTNNQLLIKQ